MRVIRHRTCRALWIALASWPWGCSKDEAAGDVVGAWCGRPVSTPAACTGDEVFYVEIAPGDGDGGNAGEGLRGVHCEAYDKECYALIDTEHTGSTLRYAYEFSGNRVDAELELTEGGDTLEGELTSTKCGGCSSPIKLYRIPE
jgi:hypothetical protein